MTGNKTPELRVLSGEEVVEQFFENITSVSGVDPAIAETLRNLYKAVNLSKQSILDALKEMRESSTK